MEEALGATAKAFEGRRQTTVYGAEVRALILQAIAALG
ncbi:hypothetical protein J2S68_004982 [Glycomyces algeriensis]|nr:hypothetical protein [Glycomyces algeriensis]